MSVFIKNAVTEVKIGTSTPIVCSDEAQNVTITPAQTPMTFTGISGKTVSEAGAVTWSASFAYGQNWESTTSIANTLFDNEDKAATLSFWPRGKTKPGWAVNVTLTPGAIGGAAGAAISTVVLPVSGKPTKIPAVP